MSVDAIAVINETRFVWLPTVLGLLLWWLSCEVRGLMTDLRERK